MKHYIYLFLIGLFIFQACKEDELGPAEQDSTAPSPVSNITTEAAPGGATVFYSIPKDDDLLYVKAEFDLNGQKSEVRASFYNNSLLIKGFGDTLTHKVKLYAVDKSENESEPVTINIKPGIPPIISASKTINITSTWGGAKFEWEDETGSPLKYHLISLDTLGNLKTMKTVYSSALNNKGYLRGYDAVETPFAVVVQDRWANVSDTIWPQTGKMLVPRAESKLDKSKITKKILDNDPDWNQFGFKYEWAYDNDLNTVAHCAAGNGWPVYYTVDLGAEIKMSRMHFWQRQNQPYKHGNPRKFTVYGCLEEPSQDGSLDCWTKIVSHTIVKPSGLPLESETDEDKQKVKAGEPIELPEDCPKIRYLRFEINETWSGSTFTYICEFNLWGAITELE